MCYEQRLTKEGWAEKQYPEYYRNEERRISSCSEIPKESLFPPPTSCQNVGFQRMNRLTDIESGAAWTENTDDLPGSLQSAYVAYLSEDKGTQGTLKLLLLEEVLW